MARPMSIPMHALLPSSPIVPVVTLTDATHATALADALTAGGISIIEITLRTPEGLKAIAALRDRTDVVVGAGTVRNAADVTAAAEAGARFLVAPGLSREIVEAAQSAALPVIPGIATGSDLLEAIALGLTHVKLFPAGALGGLDAVRALSAPFPEISFMPSGGVTAENAPHYMRHEAVFAVSGSWMVPPDAVEARDWRRIERLSRAAAEAVVGDGA